MTTLKAQTKVSVVDLRNYSGKWYVIASIPTKFDKRWNYVTETYTLNKKGNIDIFTTYKRDGRDNERAFTSKGFPITTSNNVRWKVQIIWPFKADYLIEELAEDYTYVVVGHPKQKYLYIMNRSGKMGNIQYEELLKRFVDKGYDMSKLRKIDQGFNP